MPCHQRAQSPVPGSISAPPPPKRRRTGADLLSITGDGSDPFVREERETYAGLSSRNDVRTETPAAAKGTNINTALPNNTVEILQSATANWSFLNMPKEKDATASQRSVAEDSIRADIPGHSVAANTIPPPSATMISHASPLDKTQRHAAPPSLPSPAPSDENHASPVGGARQLQHPPVSTTPLQQFISGVFRPPSSTSSPLIGVQYVPPPVVTANVPVLPVQQAPHNQPQISSQQHFAPPPQTLRTRMLSGSPPQLLTTPVTPAPPAPVVARPQQNTQPFVASRVPMPTLRQRIDWITGRLQQNNQLNELEAGRLTLLRDSIEKQDWFFQSLHQLLCLRTCSPSLLPPSIRSLGDEYFERVEQMLCPNTNIALEFVKFASDFPEPLMDLYADRQGSRETYEFRIAQIKTFLTRLHANYTDFLETHRQRRAPPLVQDMHEKLGLNSRVLQTVFFNTIMRMTWGVPDAPEMQELTQLHHLDGNTFYNNWPGFIRNDSEKNHLYLCFENIFEYFNAHRDDPQRGPCPNAQERLAVFKRAPERMQMEAARRQAQHAAAAWAAATGQPGPVAQNGASPAPAAASAARPPTPQQQQLLLQGNLLTPQQQQQVRMQMQMQMPPASMPQSQQQATAQAMQQRQMMSQRQQGQQQQPQQALRGRPRSAQPSLGPSLRSNIVVANPPSGPMAAPTPTLPSQSSNARRPRGRPPANKNKPQLSAIFPPEGAPPRPQPTQPDTIRTGLHQAHLRSPLLGPKELSPGLPRLYQHVVGYAIPPTQASTKPVQTMTFTLSTEAMLRIPTLTPSGPGEPPTMLLSEGTCTYRLRCSVLPRKGFVREEEWVVADNVWPEEFSFAFNDTMLEMRRKLHHGRYLPINLTSMIRPGENTLKLYVNHLATSKPLPLHAIAIEAVGSKPHEKILSEIQHLSAEESLSAIQKSLNPDNQPSAGDDSDDEIAVTSSNLSINLFDPYTGCNIFAIPVRGTSCLHRDPFDLETFLSQCKRHHPGWPTVVDCWRCPICRSDVRPQKLIIDGFLVAVRKQLEQQGSLDTRAIVVNPDGTWTTKSEERLTGVRSPSLVREEEEAAKAKARKASATKPAAPIPKKVIEVIELD